MKGEVKDLEFFILIIQIFNKCTPYIYWISVLFTKKNNIKPDQR
jgi:hypothetical protein